MLVEAGLVGRRRRGVRVVERRVARCVRVNRAALSQRKGMREDGGEAWEQLARATRRRAKGCACARGHHVDVRAHVRDEETPYRRDASRSRLWTCASCSPALSCWVCACNNRERVVMQNPIDILRQEPHAHVHGAPPAPRPRTARPHARAPARSVNQRMSQRYLEPA